MLPTALDRTTGGVIWEKQYGKVEDGPANRALRLDDDVAEALYSPNRLVPAYTKSQMTPLKNNYNGATPGPWYIPAWRLTLKHGRSSDLTLSAIQISSRRG
jgi:hypothetical protein